MTKVMPMPESANTMGSRAGSAPGAKRRTPMCAAAKAANRPNGTASVWNEHGARVDHVQGVQQGHGERCGYEQEQFGRAATHCAAPPSVVVLADVAASDEPLDPTASAGPGIRRRGRIARRARAPPRRPGLPRPARWRGRRAAPWSWTRRSGRDSRPARPAHTERMETNETIAVMAMTFTAESVVNAAVLLGELRALRTVVGDVHHHHGHVSRRRPPQARRPPGYRCRSGRWSLLRHAPIRRRGSCSTIRRSTGIRRSPSSTFRVKWSAYAWRVGNPARG